MIAVIQRVSSANVEVNDKPSGSINVGLLVLLGVYKNDNEQDAEFLTNKIINFRIFPDDNSNMNLSIRDIQGSILVVSQFTICADWKKGRRPSFNNVAKPEKGEKLYEYFIKKIIENKIPVETGIFGEMMNVNLINSGPVTFVLDSNE